MATYYWVGGTGTWDGSSTANWSNATGGAPGFGPPLAADTVNFDSASGTGTCTTAAGSACATATLNSSTLGVTLGANHTMSGNFTLTLGTLSLGTSTLSCNTFISSNSNVRTIDFGTGNITVTANSTTVVNMSTGTNCTFAGTPTFNSTYSGATGTRTFAISSVPTPRANINISAGTDIVTLGSSYANNINFTGFAGSWTNSAWRSEGSLTVSTGMTVSAGTNGVIMLAESGTKTITTNGKTLDFPITFGSATSTATWQLQDNCTVGSTRIVTLTAGTLDLNGKSLTCGQFFSNNSNTRSILFGTSAINVTNNNVAVIGFNTATGYSYTGTPTFNCTYAGSTGTRTMSFGSTTGGAESNAPNVNVTAGSDTFTISNGSNIKNLDYTGFSGTLTNGTVIMRGSITYSSTMTINAGTSATTFNGTTGTQTITTNGKTLDFPLTFNGIGGTFSFADALTQGSTRAFTITNGTVKLKAGATSTVGAFATSGSNQKYLQSTTAGSQATLSQASGTVSVSNLTIQDINVTGGATWNAFLTNGNVNNGNNTGWDWFYQPGEYMYTRRKLKRLLIQ